LREQKKVNGKLVMRSYKMLTLKSRIVSLDDTKKIKKRLKVTTVL